VGYSGVHLGGPLGRLPRTKSAVVELAQISEEAIFQGGRPCSVDFLARVRQHLYLTDRVSTIPINSRVGGVRAAGNSGDYSERFYFDYDPFLIRSRSLILLRAGVLHSEFIDMCLSSFKGLSDHATTDYDFLVRAILICN
jgi:hypothetical protein